MRSLVIGSLVAAVVMFVLGFAFYASPLQSMGYGQMSDDTSAAVQQALSALPGTGTYYIPGGSDDATMAAAMAEGPVALVKYNAGGFPMVDPMVMLAGFAHMAAAAFILGLVLWTVRDRVTDLGSRMRIVMLVSLAMVWFTRMGEPIWFHSDWRNAIYVSITEWISFVVAGYILSRWFVPAGTAASARPAGAPAE